MALNVKIRSGGPNGGTSIIKDVTAMERNEAELVITTAHDGTQTFFDATVLEAGEASIRDEEVSA